MVHVKKLTTRQRVTAYLAVEGFLLDMRRRLLLDLVADITAGVRLLRLVGVLARDTLPSLNMISNSFFSKLLKYITV